MQQPIEIANYYFMCSWPIVSCLLACSLFVLSSSIIAVAAHVFLYVHEKRRAARGLGCNKLKMLVFLSRIKEKSNEI